MRLSRLSINRKEQILIGVLLFVTILCSISAWKLYSNGIRTNIREIRSADSKQKASPDLLIIGAQFCGTEYLQKLLSLHPMLRKCKNGILVNNQKVENRSNCRRSGEQIIYQSSKGLFSMPGAPEKIFEINPKMKFIFTYCDPFERMLLQMQHAWQVGQNWPKKTKINHFESFEFAQNFASTIIDIILNETKLQLPRPINNDADATSTDFKAIGLLKSFLRTGKDLKPSSFLTRSLYWLQIDRWMKIFKSENFLVLKKDDMKRSPEIFYKLEEFLKLEHKDVDASELESKWKWPELTKIVQGKGKIRYDMQAEYGSGPRPSFDLRGL